MIRTAHSEETYYTVLDEICSPHDLLNIRVPGRGTFDIFDNPTSVLRERIELMRILGRDLNEYDCISLISEFTICKMLSSIFERFSNQYIIERTPQCIDASSSQHRGGDILISIRNRNYKVPILLVDTTLSKPSEENPAIPRDKVDSEGNIRKKQKLPPGVSNILLTPTIILPLGDLQLSFRDGQYVVNMDIFQYLGNILRTSIKRNKYDPFYGMSEGDIYALKLKLRDKMLISLRDLKLKLANKYTESPRRREKTRTYNIFQERLDLIINLMESFS